MSVIIKFGSCTVGAIRGPSVAFLTSPPTPNPPPSVRPSDRVSLQIPSHSKTKAKATPVALKRPGAIALAPTCMPTRPTTFCLTSVGPQRAGPPAPPFI